MEEREEGECSDGNEDSFGLSYKPVLRPDSSMYRHVERHAPSSDEEDSSDSDSDSPLAIKRKRPNVSKMDTGSSERPDARAWMKDNGSQDCQKASKVRRRNTVWSTVMAEQTLEQEIGVFGLKRRLDQGDRSVESYDYRQAQALLRATEPQFVDSDDNHSAQEEGEEEEEDEETKNKRLSRKRHVKERLGYHKPKTKSGCRELVNVELEESMTDEEVGFTIAEALMERKPELIVHVVEVLGREKALELYNETQEVERNGGMMIMSGSRRRTSGGVYLQLVRGLNLDREDFVKIFPPDESGSLQQWRKRKRARRKRERHESKPQGETASEEGLHLGELFSDDPGGAKCPGSTPVTSPQPSDTEEPQLADSLINKLSPSPPRMVDVMPSSPAPSPEVITESGKGQEQPLETYNGGFLNIEKHPRQQTDDNRHQSGEVTSYDDEFLDIHVNEDMELF